MRSSARRPVLAYDMASVRESGKAASPLTGQLLIAMPQMEDPRFEHSVVYLFSHSNEEGAMGIIINKTIDTLTEGELFAHLKLAGKAPSPKPVHFGGPVSSELGFVLHSAEYREEGTVGIGGDFALTTSFAVLKAMSKGEGPRRRLLALGYAGWGPGQLEAEIQANGWLVPRRNNYFPNFVVSCISHI